MLVALGLWLVTQERQLEDRRRIEARQLLVVQVRQELLSRLEAKPFSIRELLARVRALLRREQPPSALLDELIVDDVTIDFRRYEARRTGRAPNDARLDMTRREFQILRALASRAGEVVTREELLNQVWGLEVFPTTRTVDNHIAGLRAKLERDPAQPRHLLTVRGVGYKWVP